jgi:uncharacterized protein
VLYADTSALIKYYLQEAGTDAVQKKIKEESSRGAGVFISDLGYAEILAAFSRRLREKLLRQDEADALTVRFEGDWESTVNRVELSTAVLAYVPGLLKKHPLRGADVVHLASALWLRDASRLGRAGMFEFTATDKQLRGAAIAESLAVFDPVPII